MCFHRKRRLHSSSFRPSSLSEPPISRPSSATELGKAVREGCFRGSSRTRLLTQRVSLNRESESSGAFFWGPVATPTVALGPRSRSLEPENLTASAKTAQTFLRLRLMRKAPSLSLRGSCVNRSGSRSSPFVHWLPKRNPLHKLSLPACQAQSAPASRRNIQSTDIESQSITETGGCQALFHYVGRFQRPVKPLFRVKWLPVEAAWGTSICWCKLWARPRTNG